MGSDKAIFLVDGNVYINGPIHRDTTSNPRGFIAILASRDINVDGNVGDGTNTDITLSSVPPTLEGIFLPTAFSMPAEPLQLLPTYNSKLMVLLSA